MGRQNKGGAFDGDSLSGRSTEHRGKPSLGGLCPCCAPLANGLEVALSVPRSRDRKLLQIETVPVAHVGFLCGQKIAPATRCWSAVNGCAQKRATSPRPPRTKLVEGVAVVRDVFAEFEESLSASDRLGLFVMEALICAPKNGRGASIAASWRHDAPDRLLVEAIDGGPGPIWQYSWNGEFSFIRFARSLRAARRVHDLGRARRPRSGRPTPSRHCRRMAMRGTSHPTVAFAKSQNGEPRYAVQHRLAGAGAPEEAGAERARSQLFARLVAGAAGHAGRRLHGSHAERLCRPAGKNRRPLQRDRLLQRPHGAGARASRTGRRPRRQDPHARPPGGDRRRLGRHGNLGQFAD